MNFNQVLMLSFEDQIEIQFTKKHKILTRGSNSLRYAQATKPREGAKIFQILNRFLELYPGTLFKNGILRHEQYNKLNNIKHYSGSVILYTPSPGLIKLYNQNNIHNSVDGVPKEITMFCGLNKYLLSSTGGEKNIFWSIYYRINVVLILTLQGNVAEVQ